MIKRNPAYINAMKRRQKSVEDAISTNTSRFDSIFKWGPIIILVVVGLGWCWTSYQNKQNVKYSHLEKRQEQLESEQRDMRKKYEQDTWNLRYRMDQRR